MLAAHHTRALALLNSLPAQASVSAPHLTAMVAALAAHPAGAIAASAAVQSAWATNASDHMYALDLSGALLELDIGVGTRAFANFLVLAPTLLKLIDGDDAAPIRLRTLRLLASLAHAKHLPPLPKSKGGVDGDDPWRSAMGIWACMFLDAFTLTPNSVRLPLLFGEVAMAILILSCRSSHSANS